ncbi:MAG: 50S ribosomal protein L29 [bacterium]
MKMVEIKELSLPELQAKLRDWEDKLDALRFQLSSGQLPNTARVTLIRRDIARLRTILREIETGIRKPKGAVG